LKGNGEKRKKGAHHKKSEGETPRGGEKKESTNTNPLEAGGGEKSRGKQPNAVSKGNADEEKSRLSPQKRGNKHKGARSGRPEEGAWSNETRYFWSPTEEKEKQKGGGALKRADEKRGGGKFWLTMGGGTVSCP